MDVFIEQLVKYKKTNSDFTKQSIALAGGVAAVLATAYVGLYLVSLMGSLGILLALCLIVGIGYGTFRIITNFNVEYEYILTNGELDVDKIVAKSNRRRLVNIEVKDFSAFGRVTQSVLDGEYDTRVYAFSDYKRPDACYAVFEKSGLGKTLLLFNPNSEFTKKLIDYLPPNIKNGLDIRSTEEER